ncbi:hypothetical protein [Staphylococcus americanisciuri]|uniref:Lipoprotein n=1 Tax=Staphylococcus americanisciuri TaxID=2973940 RepID=A0ABT2EYB4_9STAP|nr:hypothetical protein [Staphylococcus americanisciuri]MCS4485273.1 hypothetical protein [Staphylococcus americanisciuri]
MKKLLGILLASTLVLNACSNDKKDAKEEPKKETKEKTEKQKAIKDEKAKENDKGKDLTESSETNATQISVENQYSQYSQSSQTEQISQSDQQEFEAFYEQLPTYEEQMRANAEVAKQHGYTGIPNGDAGLLPTSDYYYTDDQFDSETEMPYEDAVPHKVE